MGSLVLFQRFFFSLPTMPRHCVFLCNGCCCCSYFHWCRDERSKLPLCTEADVFQEIWKKKKKQNPPRMSFESGSASVRCFHTNNIAKKNTFFALLKCQTLLKSKENWRKTVVLIVSGWVLLWPCLKAVLAIFSLTSFHNSNLFLCVVHFFCSLRWIFAASLFVECKSVLSCADRRETQKRFCV